MKQIKFNLTDDQHKELIEYKAKKLTLKGSFNLSDELRNYIKTESNRLKENN